VLLSHRKRKVFCGDFKSVDDIETPNSRLKYWHASQNVITEQKNNYIIAPNKWKFVETGENSK